MREGGKALLASAPQDRAMSAVRRGLPLAILRRVCQGAQGRTDGGKPRAPNSVRHEKGILVYITQCECGRELCSLTKQVECPRCHARIELEWPAQPITGSKGKTISERYEVKPCLTK